MQKILSRFQNIAWSAGALLFALMLTGCSPEADMKKAVEVNRKGVQALSTGNYLPALGYFKKAHDLDPKRPNYANNIGVVYLKRKKYDDAKKYFLKATELDPNYARAYFNLGVANQELKDYQSAVVSYLAAARRSPAPQVFYNLGVVYSRTGRKDLAIKSFEQFLKLAPPAFGASIKDARRKLAQLRGSAP